MTEQTTTIATPAIDAAKALREEHNAQYAIFSDKRTRVLNATMTKEQAVDLALEKWLEGPRSGVSKKDAVEAIIEWEWSETEIASQMRAADGKAYREERVLRGITQSQQSLEYRQKKMTETLAHPYLRYNTRNLLEAAVDLQEAMLTRVLWERVEDGLKAGEAPLDAVKRVSEEVTKEALSGRLNRTLSRSTSLTSNLTDDQTRNTLVGWLDDVEPLLRVY